jgi:hypothetical protein
MATESSPETIQFDLSCVHCGNPLRGYRMELSCSGCGTPAAVSMAQPTLAEASPEYLKSLAQGLLSIIIAIITLFVLGIVNVVVMFTYPSMVFNVAFQLVVMTIGLIQHTGYLKLANAGLSEDDYPAIHQTTRVIRIVTGIIIALLLVSTPFAIIWVLNTPVGLPPSNAKPTPGQMLGLLVTGAIGLLMMVFVLIRFIYVMRLFRWLFGRASDQSMVQQTKLYVWLLPVLATVGLCLLGLGPLGALIAYVVMLVQMRQHVVSAISQQRGDMR